MCSNNKMGLACISNKWLTVDPKAYSNTYNRDDGLWRTDCELVDGVEVLWSRHQGWRQGDASAGLEGAISVWIVVRRDDQADGEIVVCVKAFKLT